MARGADEKQAVISEILKFFEGSFEYGKEIRIPKRTASGEVEIKVTLTCAKENVGTYEEGKVDFNAPKENIESVKKEIDEPTQEEKENIERLVKKINENSFNF